MITFLVENGGRRRLCAINREDWHTIGGVKHFNVLSFDRHGDDARYRVYPLTLQESVIDQGFIAIYDETARAKSERFYAFVHVVWRTKSQAALLREHGLDDDGDRERVA